jgi:hypothetical protein
MHTQALKLKQTCFFKLILTLILVHGSFRKKHNAIMYNVHFHEQKSLLVVFCLFSNQCAMYFMVKETLRRIHVSVLCLARFITLQTFAQLFVIRINGRSGTEYSTVI